jgi:hypothetical protein
MVIIKEMMMSRRCTRAVSLVCTSLAQVARIGLTVVRKCMCPEEVERGAVNRVTTATDLLVVVVQEGAEVVLLYS